MNIRLCLALLLSLAGAAARADDEFNIEIGFATKAAIPAAVSRCGGAVATTARTAEVLQSKRYSNR